MDEFEKKAEGSCGLVGELSNSHLIQGFSEKDTTSYYDCNTGVISLIWQTWAPAHSDEMTDLFKFR